MKFNKLNGSAIARKSNDLNQLERKMNGKAKLLIVEDDARIARQLKWAFTDDYDICLAKDASSTLKTVLSKKPEVITLDLGLRRPGRFLIVPFARVL